MKRTVIIATVLFGLDAFVLNQGIIAIVTLFIVLPVMLIRAIISRKDKVVLKKRLTACGIYFIMAALILSSNALNNKIARSRAETLIIACEKYKGQNNAYPNELSDLVPEFIDQVPVAKYTLMTGRFIYRTSEDSHALFYIALPPFGRPTYHFEEKRWVSLD